MSLYVTCIVSGVHQVIPVRHALRSERYQRNGRLRIVQAGSGQQRGDGNLSVGYIEVQLVAAPVAEMAFAALLYTQAAVARQVGQHFCNRHTALLFQAAAR